MDRKVTRSRQGVLLRVDADSLRFLIRGGRDTVRLALRDVSRLDASRGRRSYTRRGALIGAGAGAAFGTAVAIASLGTSCGTVTLRDGREIGGVFCSTVETSDIPAAALVGAVLVAPVGALVGRLVGGERWTPVVLPTGMRPTGASGPRSGAPSRPAGVRLGVSLTLHGS
jgi:hypothetical protein